MRPTPFERLKEDLMNDARAGRGATAPARPVTSAQIANIHRMIDIVARTAESCDLDLAKHVTTQGHQIKALEEAICPRVAARLQSLENAVRSLQDAATKKAPGGEVAGFMVNGIGYTSEEGRVALIIAGGRHYRSSEHFKQAREIVDLLRRS